MNNENKLKQLSKLAKGDYVLYIDRKTLKIDCIMQIIDTELKSVGFMNIGGIMYQTYIFPATVMEYGNNLESEEEKHIQSVFSASIPLADQLSIKSITDEHHFTLIFSGYENTKKEIENLFTSNNVSEKPEEGILFKMINEKAEMICNVEDNYRHMLDIFMKLDDKYKIFTKYAKYTIWDI